ncbi:MAG: 3-coathanger stack domain-containing protein [Bacteroidota bacterium]
MKTIKIILTISALLFFHLSDAQQRRWETGNKTLYEIKAEMETYFAGLRDTIPDTSFYAEGSEYNEFQKFLDFWEPRLFPHGDFDSYHKNLFNYYNQQGMSRAGGSCGVVSIPYTWNEIGPVKKPIGSSASNGGTDQGTGPLRNLTFYQPMPNHMLTCSWSGGLFYSSTSGNSWVVGGTDGVIGPIIRTGARDAVFAPSSSNTWYVALSGSGEPGWMMYSGGIYRTYNQGGTWQQIGGQLQLNGIWNVIEKILVPANNPDVMYVATAGGLYKGTFINDPNPANVIWTLIETGKIMDIELRPANNDILYFTRFNGTTFEVGQYDHSSSGISYFTLPITVAAPTYENVKIEVTNANSDKLYVLFNHASENVWGYNCASPNGLSPIYTYDPTAVSWSFIQNAYVTFGGGNGFGVSQVNQNNFLISNDDRYKSVIGGTTTTYMSGTTGCATGHSSTNKYQYHVDIEDFVYHPAIPNEVWTTNHGGIYRSTDNGQTWTNMSIGIGCAEPLGFSDFSREPDKSLLGLYHDGSIKTITPYYNGWLPDWQRISDGDGTTPAFDSQNSNKIYTSSQNGNWYYSSSYGPLTSFYGVSDNWHSHIDVNKFTENWIYLLGTNGGGGKKVLRSFNNGVTRTDISPNFSVVLPLTSFSYNLWDVYSSPKDINTLAVHVLSEETSFASCGATDTVTAHRLFITRNANDPNVANVVSSWIEIPLPVNKWISDVEFDWENSNIIYVSFGSSDDFSGNPCGMEMIYKLDISNPSLLSSCNCNTGVCTDLTLNLPRTGVGGRSIAMERGSNGGLYLATDVGVFYTNNEMLQNTSLTDKWQKFGPNLPSTGSGSLTINYNLNRIRVACFGRGIWETNLFCPINYDLTETAVYSSDQYLEAENNITSTATVNAPRNVTYRAGNRIHLQPNFRAYNGSKFHAFIHACNHSGNSFRIAPVDDGEQWTENTEIKTEEGFTLFPNPTSGELNINIDSEISGMQYSIKAYDLSGKMVFSKNNLLKGKNTFDFSTLENGIYFIEVINSDGERQVKKLVKN